MNSHLLLASYQQFLVNTHDNFCGSKILISQFFVTPLLKRCCDLRTNLNLWSDIRNFTYMQDAAPE